MELPVVVFDVNETLSDMAPMADRFAEVGAPAHRAELWFAAQAGVWKPAPGSYAYAARACGVAPAQMLLVAVHPWDVDGALRAGLAGCWLDRSGAPYPSHCRTPTYTVSSLPELADRLG